MVCVCINSLYLCAHTYISACAWVVCAPVHRTRLRARTTCKQTSAVCVCLSIRVVGICVSCAVFSSHRDLSAYIVQRLLVRSLGATCKVFL